MWTNIICHHGRAQGEGTGGRAPPGKSIFFREFLKNKFFYDININSVLFDTKILSSERCTVWIRKLGTKGNMYTPVLVEEMLTVVQYIIYQDR